MDECKDSIQLSYRYAGWMFVTLLYAFQIFEDVHNVKKECLVVGRGGGNQAAPKCINSFFPLQHLLFHPKK